MKRAIRVVIGLWVICSIFFLPFPVNSQVEMEVIPDEWYFGNVGIGSSSSKTFTINSTGMSELTLYLAIITPDTEDLQICGVECDCDFGLVPPGFEFPTHVPADTFKTLNVTFSPISLGLREDYLYILNNSPEQNFFVPLTGNGVDSSAVPEPGTMLLLGSGLLGFWGLRRNFKK